MAECSGAPHVAGSYITAELERSLSVPLSKIRKLRSEALGREQCMTGRLAQEARIERLLLDRLIREAR